MFSQKMLLATVRTFVQEREMHHAPFLDIVASVGSCAPSALTSKINGSIKIFMHLPTKTNTS